MKPRKLILALLAAAGLFAGSAHASIIYSIDRTIGAGSVSGTITTDGTLGYLSNGECYEDGSCQFGGTPGNNIIDWSLTLFDGVKTFILMHSNSGFWSSAPSRGRVATNFFATESELIYDFDSLGFALFQVYEQGDGGPSWLLSGELNRDFEEVWAGTREDRWERDAPTEMRSGQVVVGVAVSEVPEPGSMALIALGLLGISYSRRLNLS